MPDRRVVLVVLATLLVAVSVVATTYVALTHGFATDIEIPLRASERWLAGDIVYDPEAFDRSGADLPFLYPPLALPVVAPLLWLPRLVVHAAAVAACVACALFCCRRLGLPRWTWLPALLWPPLSEGIISANVQVPLFAAYCVAFVPARGPSRIDGLLVTLVGAFKVSQFQPWLATLRRRPVAALAGAAVMIAFGLLTLPVVGLEAWASWLGQAGRAGDPAWAYAGEPLSLVVGRPLGLTITVLTAVAALVVPWRLAAAAIGLLVVVGAPSLHMYGFLFVLPSLLVVRRDVGLLAATLIASYQYPLIWAGVALAGGSLLIGERRHAIAPEVPATS
jgi:hypothetical protein